MGRSRFMGVTCRRLSSTLLLLEQEALEVTASNRDIDPVRNGGFAAA